MAVGVEQQAVYERGGVGAEAAFATAAGQVTQRPWDQATASVQFELPSSLAASSGLYAACLPWEGNGGDWAADSI